MSRRLLAAIAVLLLATAGNGPRAAAQEAEGPLDRVGRVNAVDYIRGLLENEQYDPRHGERARNGAPLAGDEHWRSSIFDGRRTRATQGTGLRLPDLPQRDDR